MENDIPSRDRVGEDAVREMWGRTLPLGTDGDTEEINAKAASLTHVTVLSFISDLFISNTRLMSELHRALQEDAQNW